MYKYKSLQASQLPREDLSFLQNLLKQEVIGDLSICIDEHSPCGLFVTGDLKDLSMSHDQKVMM